MEEFLRSGIPTFTEPSLKQKASEAGINFDSLISGFQTNQSDSQLAAQLGVSQNMISHLRQHFERYGLGAALGQD